MRKLGCALLVLAALAAAAVGAAGAWAWWSLEQPYQGFDGEVTVRIEPGLDVRQILERLERRGVIHHALPARLWLRFVRPDASLKAGEYRFAGPASTREVLEKLIRGEVLTHAVTLVEGLTLEETATALAEAGFGERRRFLSTMRSPGRIADLDPEAEDLEGYLFPETYHFATDTPEEEIVDTVVETFRSRWATEVEALLDGRDPPLGVRGVVTLASIVEKEAKIAGERPLIAGVFQNRLDRGMALYADPTVIYALKQAGRWDGNLRRVDLELDSPYNTYRYPDLPPGPIASPGLSSLAAAASPADVPYLYFVSRNDGTHVFAETLAEHNRNVERWQRRYWRERRARERTGGAPDGPDDGS